jgi:hypothetical protein
VKLLWGPAKECLPNQAGEFIFEWEDTREIRKDLGREVTMSYPWKAQHTELSLSVRGQSWGFCLQSAWRMSDGRLLHARSEGGRAGGGSEREALNPTCSEPTYSGPACLHYLLHTYLGWSHARPGQGGGNRPPTATCRPGTSGSSPASGPSPLLCGPGTLADTWRRESRVSRKYLREAPTTGP